MVFQRLINKVSHLLLDSEVITYHPDGLVYSTDAYRGQAVCPNDLEILIQHLPSFMLKCNSDRMQTQGYSLYQLKPSTTWGTDP